MKKILYIAALLLVMSSIIKFKGGHPETIAKAVKFDNGDTLEDFVRNSKILTISFDDWTLPTSNGASSLFADPTMQWLKTMHDRYGVCFTLNLYTENLASVPNKYQKEWQDNSNWLKLSFHTNGANTDYNVQSADKALSDYNYFVEQVIRFTGTYDVIDRVMRGNFFHGNLNCCKAWRDANCGIIGLYGCDDARTIHYYLTQEQTNWLNNHDRYFDAENQLWFFKTDIRYEYLGQQTSSGTVVPAKDYSTIEAWLESFKSAEKANCAHDLVIFTHQNYVTQNAYKTMMEKTFVWAKSNGYYFGFIQDIIL